MHHLNLIIYTKSTLPKNKTNKKTWYYHSEKHGIQIHTMVIKNHGITIVHIQKKHDITMVHIWKNMVLWYNNNNLKKKIF